MSKSQLNVIFWNARSIRKKYVEFFNFLSNNDVDICLLCETWLSYNIKIYHPNYDCVRYDREGSGGGVAIILKKTNSYRIIKCIETNVIETVGIILNLSNQTICKIICVYLTVVRLK